MFSGDVVAAIAQNFGRDQLTSFERCAFRRVLARFVDDLSHWAEAGEALDAMTSCMFVQSALSFVTTIGIHISIASTH